MLKMVISCGGGMSSSAITKHMKDEIKEKGWEDRVQVDFLPFPLLMKEKDMSFPISDNISLDYDIALLCPHLRYYALDAIKKKKDIDIPMYVMPAMMYGKMNLEDLMEDAIDLLELYKDRDDKLLHFPDEEILDIKRNISHRKWVKTHKR